MIKNKQCPLPDSSSIGFLSYNSLLSHFIVLVSKINMFFHKQIRMEMKCHCYDVVDVDISNIFYNSWKQIFLNV